MDLQQGCRPTGHRTGEPLSRLHEIRCSLEEKVELLKKLDVEILDYIEEDALADEVAQLNDLAGAVYSAIIMANTVHPPLSSITPSAHSTRLVSSPVTPSHDRVRLPKLTLRSFAGDMTQCPTFWDSFKSAVHDNDQLVPVDKFNYLRPLLTGTALEAISGLMLTDSNYKNAVENLEKRFGNHQQIISKHVNLLLNTPAVSSTNNLSGLRHIYDFVETHTRSLSSLGVTPDSYGSLLSSVLINKLPTEVQLLMSRNISEEEWKLNRLLKVFHEELQARERVVTDKSTSSTADVSLIGTSGKQASHTATTLVLGASSSCCYCQQAHLSKDCRVVTQIEARRQILQRSGRCCVCLHAGHISRDCRSESRCSQCGEKHHTSICLGECSNDPD